MPKFSAGGQDAFGFTQGVKLWLFFGMAWLPTSLLQSFVAAGSFWSLGRFTILMRCFDHIDLRVRNLAEVRSFYEILLPALGFGKEVKIEGWIQYERAGENGAAEFFGVTESSQHIANECRIAFWAPGVAEVNRLAEIARQAGACNIEGPTWEVPGYYAVFFEDASGNRFEICHREQG